MRLPFPFVSLLLVLALLSNTPAAKAQGDSVTYLLHKFAQAIGKETCYRKDSAGIIEYDIRFKFTDRGSPVPLNALLRMNRQYEPISLFIKGSTSRFSTINDTVSIADGMAHNKVDDSLFTNKFVAPMFTVAGYAPGTVQMSLLQYWRSHQRPAIINTLPTGTVKITADGKDTLHTDGKAIVLERFALSGLIWGNELVWTDTQGNLFCLITNDAEGDKLEIMLEPFENLLPEMLSRGALYGLRLFNNASVMKPAQAGNKLAITGGTVLDVKTGKTASNQVLLINNGMISQAGPAGSISIPAGYRIIHAEGKTILPGLWDMHAHFEQAEWGPAYLAAGVTTVRDCGNEFVYINAIKKAIDEQGGIGPHIIKAGIIDGPGAMGLGIVRATTDEEAIRAVRLYKDNGFEQIKIYSSVKPHTVKVISDEAHRLGLTVTGHIPMGMNILQGIDSGMDQVNHLQYVYSVMKRNKDRSVDLADSMSIRAFDKIRASNMVIDPTMGVFEMIFRNVKEPITQLEPAFYSLPQPLQVLFKNSGSDPETAEKLKPMFAAYFQLIKALHDKGITIVAGTDMGFPGYSLARELELYVQAGLTPAEAIQTATIIPARVMKKDDQYGSLEAGKKADLIIVDGDPLKNIREIRKVQWVVKEGTVYDPALLHRMVGFEK